MLIFEIFIILRKESINFGTWFHSHKRVVHWFNRETGPVSHPIFRGRDPRCRINAGKNGKASGCNCLLQGCSDVLKWTWEDVVLMFALAYLGVWVKIGYPKNWMVNPKNQLKSVAPQVFNFDPHQFSSIFGWKSHQPLHGWAARDECLVVV